MNRVWAWLSLPAVTGTSIVVGVVGFVLSVYTAFYYEKRPDIVVTIDTFSKVVDVARPVGGLEISYAGQDLRQTQKTLWVLTATIKNNGNAELRRGDYDDKAPLGLEFGDAVVVDRPSVKTKSTYLQKNLMVTVEQGRLLFSPVIVEAGEAFEVTALVLGSNTVRPAVTVVGKIAGAQTITLVSPESTPKDGVWQQAVLSGGPLVQLVRLPVYSVGALFVIAVVVMFAFTIMRPFAARQERKDMVTRQAQVRAFKPGESISPAIRFLGDLYISKGERGLGWAAQALAFPTKAGRFNLVTALGSEENGGVEERELLAPLPLTVARLIEVGLYRAVEDGTPIVPKEAREDFDEFVKHLGLDQDELLARGGRLVATLTIDNPHALPGDTFS